MTTRVPPAATAHSWGSANSLDSRNIDHKDHSQRMKVLSRGFIRGGIGRSGWQGGAVHPGHTKIVTPKGALHETNRILVETARQRAHNSATPRNRSTENVHSTVKCWQLIQLQGI
jgi:hypothetical protein